MHSFCDITNIMRAQIVQFNPFAFASNLKLIKSTDDSDCKTFLTNSPRSNRWWARARVAFVEVCRDFSFLSRRRTRLLKKIRSSSNQKNLYIKIPLKIGVKRKSAQKLWKKYAHTLRRSVSYCTRLLSCNTLQLTICCFIFMFVRFVRCCLASSQLQSSMPCPSPSIAHRIRATPLTRNFQFVCEPNTVCRKHRHGPEKIAKQKKKRIQTHENRRSRNAFIDREPAR